MAHNKNHSFELKPESDGQYQLKTRFSKFTNLPELMSMFKECADIRTADAVTRCYRSGRRETTDERRGVGVYYKLIANMD